MNHKIFAALSLTLAASTASSLTFEGGLNHTAYLDDNGVLYTSGDSTQNRMCRSGIIGDGFQPISIPETVTDIDAGNFTTLAIGESGQLYICGLSYSTSGAYAHPWFPNVKDASFMSNNLVTLMSDGSTIYEYYVATKKVKTYSVPNAIKLESGVDHTLVLTNSGEVYSWGNNNYGQLGIASTNPTSTPTKIQNIPQIVDIDVSGTHSVLLDVNGHAWAFGFNEHGRLAIGSESNSAVPVQIPLDNVEKIAAGYLQTGLIANGKSYVAGYSSYKVPERDILFSTLSPTEVLEVGNTREIFAGVGSQSIFVTTGNQVYGLGNGRHSQLALLEEDYFNGAIASRPQLMNIPLDPVVEVIPPQVDDVQPGGSYIITGTNFGEEDGIVSMGDYIFTIKSWEDQVIHIENPEYEMTGDLVVVDIYGEVSNTFYVTLEPDAPSDTPVDECGAVYPLLDKLHDLRAERFFTNLDFAKLSSSDKKDARDEYTAKKKSLNDEIKSVNKELQALRKSGCSFNKNKYWRDNGMEFNKFQFTEEMEAEAIQAAEENSNKRGNSKKDK